MTLKDRTVLVIGRGGGIARAATDAVREAGGSVVVAGRDAEALAAAYPDVRVETVDVTDEASVAALAERVGAVDHVVSTASARARGPVGQLDPDVVALSLRTKAVGAILLAKHFATQMPADGSFLLFSGATAVKPAAGMLAVAATNGAVDAIVRSLAVELAPIRVNAISPGTIDSGAYDALGPEKKAQLYAGRSKTNPARRIGTPGDVAEAVVFALTNTFLTGVSLGLDGGERLV
ncbi:SDR family oxidoreductase [Asanoa sp. WMMD1127]|uniref:SDR family oxidoreductase n=1 Tax=Asanoa sp. WMMD1127 TaxID=3016107 RepID=UPI0024173457|nr:SDR family oxidoreductase [Asanoa sp. WMMD1127]MDG4824487.1 SDR family oxidoreductase [Asanoa sp. WMMD1127]